MSELVFPLFLDLAVALFGLTAPDWAALPLTMPQFKVLALLLRGDTPTVTEVARVLHVTPPTASGILDRLEEKRLVIREDDPADRRVVHVRLAADRQTLVRQLFPSAERTLDSQFAALDESERDHLEHALRQMLAALQSPSAERTPLRRPSPLEARS